MPDQIAELSGDDAVNIIGYGACGMCYAFTYSITKQSIVFQYCMSQKDIQQYACDSPIPVISPLPEWGFVGSKHECSECLCKISNTLVRDRPAVGEHFNNERLVPE